MLAEAQRHKRIRNGAYHFKELVVKAVCSEAAKKSLSIFARDLTIRFDCIRTLGIQSPSSRWTVSRLGCCCYSWCNQSMLTGPCFHWGFGHVQTEQWIQCKVTAAQLQAKVPIQRRHNDSTNLKTILTLLNVGYD